MRVELKIRGARMIPFRETEVPGTYEDYELKSNVLNEVQLVAALPPGFLPVPVVDIMLAVKEPGDKGFYRSVSSPALFHNWGRHYDNYVLVVSRGPGVVKEPWWISLLKKIVGHKPSIQID